MAGGDEVQIGQVQARVPGGGGRVTTRTYLSIGDVLSLLRQEFPDITISKIRFLESQGLVNPGVRRRATASSTSTTSSACAGCCASSVSTSCR